jgi:hypothetical protein
VRKSLLKSGTQSWTLRAIDKVFILKKAPAVGASSYIPGLNLIHFPIELCSLIEGCVNFPGTAKN